VLNYRRAELCVSYSDPEGLEHSVVVMGDSLFEAAAAAGMSRSAFASRFKELLGQTPLDYVTDWRMQKATQLLNQRDKKLAEIAQSVGYESDAAFSKVFKRVVGVAPAEYRRNGLEGPQQGMA